MRGWLNVPNCIRHLQESGIEISDEQAAEWIAQDKARRAAERANKRELKKSCGHFRRHWTRIRSPDRPTVDREYCSDCRITLSEHPVKGPPPKGREPIPVPRSA